VSTRFADKLDALFHLLPWAPPPHCRERHSVGYAAGLGVFVGRLPIEQARLDELFGVALSPDGAARRGRYRNVVQPRRSWRCSCGARQTRSPPQ